ncbi:hypothetical protein ACS0TY_018609 [Phlomoides rotata]
MDFNLKGKFLAGNIYHQFESICRDVDEFVNKDTKKFVENRVQCVGMSVKRFYSVVQDILPLSGDEVKPKSHLMDAEQVDMQDHVPVTSINTNSTCISEKQVSLNQGTIHTLGDSDASLPIKFDHTTQISEPPYEDLSPGAETSLHMGECSDAIIRNGEESGVEEVITRVAIPVTTNSCLESLDKDVLSGVSNEDHNGSALTLSSSPVFPAHEVDLTTMKEETWHFNHLKGNKSIFYDPGCLFDSSSNCRFLGSKLTLNEEQNSYSNENGSLSSPSAYSANKINEDNSLLMDLPVPSACDANASALVKDRVLSDHFSTKDDNLHVSTSVESPPECMLSHFSWKGKEVNMGNTPPCCCIMEPTSADSIMKTENICPVHSKRDGLTVNISTPSLVTVPDETKGVDVLPSFLILKSNDNNVIQTDKSELVNASSDRHKHHKDGHPEMLMSPSESEHCGNIDMETVDLSSDLKNDGIILVSKSSCVHAASCRRNFRYYKKLIHDAFTSQKRISKEYEHLAILYGDIDKESNQLFEPSSVPSVLNNHAGKTQSSENMSITEWHLV